ncbi:MAG: thiamine pyrophosphate-binding protein, partial [Candidatus Limnocylindrales bacterium]
MARLTVAQAIVTWLANQYVERDGQRQRFFEGVYGIFGHGNVAGLGEALEAAQGEVRYYQARNEQAMVHTAVAFAKQSMRLRTFACTSSIGPGATNMVTGAANATVNRLPVLLLPGDRFATRRVKPVLQQLEATDAGDVSANDVFRPVSRYFDRIERPEALIDALPQAMRVLTSPAETGAVTLALPQDVQAEAWDWPAGLLEARTWIVPRPRPDATALASAVALIAGAQRPMIVVGGGVVYSDTAAALDQFVRRFGIPFTETQAGKGALPWDHPLNMGAIGSTGTSAG